MRRHAILLLIILIPFITLCQSWEIVYPQTDAVYLSAGDGNDEGYYILGKSANENNYGREVAYALYVDNDGGYMYSTFQNVAVQSKFMSAVCLNDGNAFVAGAKSSHDNSDIYDSLWIVILNPDLEIVGEHTYALEYPYFSVDYICVTHGNHDDIVMAAQAKKINSNGYSVDMNCLASRFDVHGNMLDGNYIEVSHPLGRADVRDVTMMPNTENIMVMDSGFNPTGFPCVSYMDQNFRFFSHHRLLENRWHGLWLNSGIWLDDTKFLMAGMMTDRAVPAKKEFAAIFKCDTALVFLDTLVYDRIDTADYIPCCRAMEYVNDTTIYFVTYREPYFDKKSNDNNDVTVILVDKNLNLLGSRHLRFDDRVFRINHVQKTNDDGILLYGNSEHDYQHEVYVKKLLREDIVVPCSIVEQSDEVYENGVFPNPANDVLNISVRSHGNKLLTVLIRDVNGRKVLEREFMLSEDSIIRMDVSSFEKGVYFYQVLDCGNTISGKFIKE